MSSAIETAFAIVTPSYFPDLGRCQLLVESLERTGATCKHYLIIDRTDYAAFAHLASNRVIIIKSEDILEYWLHRLPGRGGYWASLRSLPVRGWIIQQILKLAIASHVPESTLIYCDSDTSFVRHFSIDDILIGKKVGLLDVDFADSNVAKWTKIACRLLGCDAESVTFRGHVGNMICWQRKNILLLHEKLQAVSGQSWQLTIARERHFSEYILYGVFIRACLGYDASGHAQSTKPLVTNSWELDLSSDQALSDFFYNIDPQSVAVMVHSKDGIDPARLRPHLEKFW
jgi:hypothetical protein